MNELALLYGHLREVTRDNGKAALIEGEPGIDKTTLTRTTLAARLLNLPGLLGHGR